MRRGLKVGGIGLGIDRDARIFAARAALTTTTQLTAVNNLVVQTKQIDSGAVWAKIRVLYPFVGATALAHGLNLKSPGTLSMSWSGPLSHTAQGVVSVVGTCMGLTPYVPVSNEAYAAVYISQSAGPYPSLDWAARVASGLNTGITAQWTGTNNFQGDIGSVSGGAGRLAVTTALATGYKAVSRVGTAQALYENNTLRTTGAFSVSAVPTEPYALCNSPSASSFLNSAARTYASAVAGDGLTQSQHNGLFAAIQVYQTALGRAA